MVRTEWGKEDLCMGSRRGDPAPAQLFPLGGGSLPSLLLFEQQLAKPRGCWQATLWMPWGRGSGRQGTLPIDFWTSLSGRYCTLGMGTAKSLSQPYSPPPHYPSGVSVGGLGVVMEKGACGLDEAWRVGRAQSLFCVEHYS